MKVHEEVPEALAGERIDRVMAMLTGRSRAEVAGLIDAGIVLVGGSPATSRSTRVRVGDVIEADVPEVDVQADMVPEPSLDVPIVHSDEHLLVVDKPAGPVVHPRPGPRRGTPLPPPPATPP